MQKSKIIYIIVIIFYLITTKFTLAHENCNEITIGFSPGNSAKNIILHAIENAKSSIDIAAYSFTSKPITLALINAQNKGIKIRIVADKKSNTNKYTAVTYLVNHKIPVKLNDKYSIMHNKFMIFDNNSVQTGSFNYTQNAISRNAENIIYVKNNIKIAKIYTNEFNRLWKESIKVYPNIFIGNNFIKNK
ncbi:MAG: Phospholipase D [Candidatus Westeberhardia cardiocondylae]|nr:Phospholipase D [Candidatus Westeberhardia cardiocondylae]